MFIPHSLNSDQTQGETKDRNAVVVPAAIEKDIEVENVRLVVEVRRDVEEAEVESENKVEKGTEERGEVIAEKDIVIAIGDEMEAGTEKAVAANQGETDLRKVILAKRLWTCTVCIYLHLFQLSSHSFPHAECTLFLTYDRK